MNTLRHSDRAHRWAGILLAAGLSSRMGTSKARLDWGGTSLLRSQIAALTEAGAAQVIAVVSAVDADLVEAPAVPIRNLHPERGRTHSLRLGLSALEPCAAILLVSVDQPRGPALLTNLVDAHFGNERAITIPVHRGRRGHPVVYSRSLLAEMLAASEEKEGLRGIVRADRARIAEWETDDPTVGLDLNTPDEYERARPR